MCLQKMKLPKQLKVFDFANRGLIFSTDIKIKDLPEINKIANNKNDYLKVSMSFFLNNGKTPCVKGSISANITLDCQRCLEDIYMDLNINFNLAFIENENEKFDSSFEPYLLTNYEIATIDLISEEILLTIPISPTHKYNCKNYKEFESQENSYKPFAILKKH